MVSTVTGTKNFEGIVSLLKILIPSSTTGEWHNSVNEIGYMDLKIHRSQMAWKENHLD